MRGTEGADTGSAGDMSPASATPMFESVLFWWSTISKNVDWINYHNQKQFVQFSTNNVKGLYRYGYVIGRTRRVYQVKSLLFI